MYEKCILCLIVRYFGNYFWFSFNAMYLRENNSNLSKTKNIFFVGTFPIPSQNEKIFAWYEKRFLIMSNFYLVELLSEPNSLTIVTSKKILKMGSYMLILSIFFLLNENQEFAVCWLFNIFCVFYVFGALGLLLWLNSKVRGECLTS